MMRIPMAEPGLVNSFGELLSVILLCAIRQIYSAETSSVAAGPAESNNAVHDQRNEASGP